MTLRHAALAALLAFLAACGPPPPTGGTEVYRISARDARQIPERAAEAVNAQRATRGAPPLQFSPQLTAAAQSHAFG